MDSEDDMQNDVDSLDDFSSGDAGMASDDVDANFEFDDDTDDCTSHRQQQEYTILNAEDIRQRLEGDITEISAVLSLPKASASILLRHYNWDVGKLHDAWFADEENVRKAVGLLERPIVDDVSNNKKLKLTCGICFDAHRSNRMLAAACGHHFCSTCWTSYVSTSINDGPGCLMLRCPDPSCTAAVSEDMINILVSDEDKQKYSRYLVRSYIEENKMIKWCPAPGCDFAVDFVAGSASYDVSCTCTYSFCWNCIEDAHRPVDCSTVEKWVLKNKAESENTNWILAYTKPCPKCKKPIEKNQGCSHMTCRPPCSFQFCWLCLGPWLNHRCNAYGIEKQEGGDNEAEKRRKMAKKSIERYTHYYERWASNQSAREKAIANLHQMKTVNIDKLRDVQGQNEAQVKFITEAWLQIIECRRFLKWTYAYGYYFPEEEHAKRRLFEYLQGEAESGLENLHSCAEKELQPHLHANGPYEGFNSFRTKLVNLTKVTRNYFENLVQALENGLSDVNSLWTCESCTYANVMDATICQICKRGWSCEYCTYSANERTANTCKMCKRHR